MILDLGVALGKFVSAALPPIVGLQIGLQDLAALSADKTAVFRSVSADVGNWRLQAVTNLDVPTKTAALLLLGAPAARMPRCVKLNNYWCIKRAGWRGERGADAEGHVAFETADAGARAAALLLRRYYREFGRRSALAIVSRWAPNRCLGPGVAAVAAGGGTLPTVPSLTSWQRLSKEQKDRTFDHLIAERRRVAEARYRMTIQAIATAKRAASLRRPHQTAKPRPPVAIAATPMPAPRPSRAATPPRRVTAITPISCVLEAARISSYARRAIVGIAAAPTEDLLLFDKRGSATWRLAKLMANMAGVEIGPQKIVESLLPPALAALDAGDETNAAGVTSQSRALPEARRPTDPSTVGIKAPPS